MEVHGDKEVHLQPVKDPHAGAGRVPKKAGTLCWSRLLAGPVALWKDLSWSVDGTYEGLYAVEGTYADAINEGLSSEGVTSPWRRGKVAEKMRDELTTISIPRPHCW